MHVSHVIHGGGDGAQIVRLCGVVRGQLGVHGISSLIDDAACGERLGRNVIDPKLAMLLLRQL